jgi:general secretion pathway protein A
MYNSYFGFSESPFENKLDQKFFFPSEDHREVLVALLYFIKEEKGFAAVCGDVGTGKTMLINRLLSMLPDHIQPIIITAPTVDYLDILHYLAKTLSIRDSRQGVLELIDEVKQALVEARKKKKQSVLELIDEVKQALVEARKKKKIFVLIVDEADLLSDASLEGIRLLSNIETENNKFFSILLVGQNELSPKLSRPTMQQSININRFLFPLGPSETIQYVKHRLSKVGADFNACFESKCQGLIYKMTEGVPRKINQLCDNALLICMTERLKKVDRKILKKAREALLTDLIFSPKASAHSNFRLVNKLKFISASTGLAAASICLSFFLIAVLLALSGLMGDGVQKALFRYSLVPKSFTLDSVFSGLSKDQGKTNIRVHEKEATDTGKEVLPGSPLYDENSSAARGVQAPDAM